jgi:hypothetical protein
VKEFLLIHHYRSTVLAPGAAVAQKFPVSEL